MAHTSAWHFTDTLVVEFAVYPRPERLFKTTWWENKKKSGPSWCWIFWGGWCWCYLDLSLVSPHLLSCRLDSTVIMAASCSCCWYPFYCLCEHAAHFVLLYSSKHELMEWYISPLQTRLHKKGVCGTCTHLTLDSAEAVMWPALPRW